LGQRGCRIARARRATAVYRRCARALEFDDIDFFRAVIDAHSRAREYAATTPRRSTLQSPELEPAPKRAQTGNVFPGPKKHRRPHFAAKAERSFTVLGATRDHLRDDDNDRRDDDRRDRDCSEPIVNNNTNTFIIYK